MVGYFYAFISVFFWSFNVLISRFLAAEMTPVQISFGRWLIASLILLPFTFGRVKSSWPVIKKNFRMITVMSLTGVVLMNTFVYYAGHTAGVIDMALLGATSPIFLVVLSTIFLKTKLSFHQFLGFVIAFFGVLLIITKGHLLKLEQFSFVRGDFWMLTMALTFGIYGVVQTKKIPELSQITLLAVMIFEGTVILFPFFIGSLFVSPLISLTGKGIAIDVYLAIFNSIFAYLFWDIALAKIGALKTGLVYYLMPVLSAIEAYFILGEKISMMQIVGGISVLAGVFVAAYHHPKHQVTLLRI